MSAFEEEPPRTLELSRPRACAARCWVERASRLRKMNAQMHSRSMTMNRTVTPPGRSFSGALRMAVSTTMSTARLTTDNTISPR